MKKHPPLDTHPHLKEFVAFLDHLNTESQRGQVLISAAVIDDLLTQTTAGFLIEGASADKLLSGFNAPLGTLSARIEMGRRSRPYQRRRTPRRDGYQKNPGAADFQTEALPPCSED